MTRARRFAPPVDHRRLREATVLPSSFNEADNSFEVCWTTGAAVVRFDWLSGEYFDETLSVEAGAVRLERLDDRGPFLNSHRQDDVADLLGSVVPGSIRLAGGNGYARVQLATSDDVQNIIAKIKGGHLRKVSVGYTVHVYERIERRGKRPEMRAIDWEPVEISLVTVPADTGAQIRSKGRIMPQQHQLDDDQEDIVTPKFVRDKCRNLGFSDKDTLDLVEEFAGQDRTRAEFLEAMIERVARRPNRQQLVDQYIADRRMEPIDNGITDDPGRSVDQRWAGDYPTGQHPVATRMQGALYARIAGKAPADESREFMGASMVDLARGILELQGVRNVRYKSPSEIWQLTKRSGAMTTSDFPAILAGALGTYLTEQYQAAPSALQAVARLREVNDFREIRALWVDGQVELLVVEENGEYTHGSIVEGTETYKLATFGKILALTRQLLINDNLGAFSAIGSWFARKGAEKRGDILAAVLLSNPPMADGKGLFHADHANLAPAGTAITIPALSAGRQKLREQTDRDGRTRLGLAPKFLVVGPAKETEAEQVLTQLAAAKSDDANPFPGKLTLAVEPRITDNSWFLFADPAQAAALEYATLRGQGDSVFIDTRVGFEVDAIETKGRIDFGAGAVDHRGAYKNPRQLISGRCGRGLRRAPDQKLVAGLPREIANLPFSPATGSR